MEKEQLEKKILWLEAERRKSAEAAAELEKRLAALEKSLSKEQLGSKTRGASLTRVGALEEQIGELEKEFKAQRIQLSKDLEAVSKQRKAKEDEGSQTQKNASAVLEDFRKEIAQLQNMQKGLNTLGQKVEPFDAAIEKLEGSIERVLAGEEKRIELARSLEDNSKKDVQRLTEMHAEVAALISRLEASAKKTELILIGQRKVDKRMDEVEEAETKRVQEQKSFLERIAGESADQKRQFKEWAERFQQVEQQSTEISQHLKDIETTDLAVKRAQKTFDDLVEKINRRVNELGEIQRLGDQRFRQEWSTFQADAQKRWANFNLTQEEQLKEGGRQRDKLAAQISDLEDSLREVQDGLQHMTEQSERNLQAVLEMARDSLAENERFLSNGNRP